MKKYVDAQPTVALFGYLLRFSRYFERTELHKISAEQDWARPGLTMILPSAPARWGPIDPRRDWHEWAAILSGAGLPHTRRHIPARSWSVKTCICKSFRRPSVTPTPVASVAVFGWAEDAGRRSEVPRVRQTKWRSVFDAGLARGTRAPEEAGIDDVRYPNLCD